jgi:hypothetical protein
MDITSKIGFCGKKFLSSLRYETFSIVYVLNGTAQVSFDLTHCSDDGGSKHH